LSASRLEDTTEKGRYVDYPPEDGPDGGAWSERFERGRFSSQLAFARQTLASLEPRVAVTDSVRPAMNR
jgi:hypothetical protein